MTTLPARLREQAARREGVLDLERDLAMAAGDVADLREAAWMLEEYAMMRKTLSDIEDVACSGSVPGSHSRTAARAYAEALRWIEGAAANTRTALVNPAPPVTP